MASHIRGDDDVLALLDEMTGGGSVSLTSNLRETSAAMHNNVDTTRQQHNDNNNNKAFESLLAAYKLSPPTNIHVEIIRHRAHEKFKSNFYELFRNCVASHQSTSTANMTSSSTSNKDDIRNQCIRSTIYKLWKAMPVHSIWERFQFTLKTCEADCVREVQRRSQEDYTQPWCSTAANISNDQLIQHLANPSIHEIQAYILHGRNNGTIWEPLLPVSTISTSSSTTNDTSLQQINQKYKEATLLLLQEEIKFQMSRTFKQLIGPGSGRSSKDSESLSLDKVYNTLVNEEEVKTTDDVKKKKKKKSKKRKKDKHMNKEDTVNKEEYILETIYKSTSFTKLTNKLHKKFMFLAEDSYTTNFINELNKCCNRLLIEEQHQSNNGGGMRSNNKKKKRKRKSSSSSMPKITLVENDIKNIDTSGNRKTNQQQQQQQLMVSFQGISLRINQVHKNKLYSMYQHTLSTLLPGVDNNIMNEYLQQFPKLLFTILLRYDALEGAGLQSAIPSSVFDYLNSRFGCNFECFASPFNCWLEEESVSSNGNSSSSIVRGGNFGSVFADTDALFGSRGSFFGMDFVKMTVGEDEGGCFQANPPFASEFIQRMCNYMHRFLGDDGSGSSNDSGGSKKEKTVPLMFVIFVPAWSESVGWKTLHSSPHLTKHILLSQKDDVHYYSEGTQHRRTLDNGGSYRIASFDTSVFFLQNEAAKRKWPLEDSDDETRLKAAFAMNKIDDEKKKVVVKKIDGTQKKKKTNPKSSVKSEEPVEKQQPCDSASTISDKQKKRKKKQKVDHKGSSKKKRLISGGNDEMSILKSMGILDDSVASKKDEKAGGTSIGGGKKKKRRHKR